MQEEYSPYYIVNIAVVPLRGEPDQRTEQVTQARLGEILRFVGEEDGWYSVKLETDGYEGYVNPAMVVGFSEEDAREWREAKKFIIGDRTADILEAPYEGALPIRTAVMSVKLPLLERKGGWVKLKLPDGLEGWTDSRSFNVQDMGKRDGIVNTAKMFTGAPYLWGGRSSGGFDCSGFIQTVFELNGISLPRDTGQQIGVGKSIGREWNKARGGDLVFFGNSEGRVNHVGIYLEDGHVIHCSGLVHVNSLNPEDKVHSPSLLRRFIEVKSIRDLLK